MPREVQVWRRAVVCLSKVTEATKSNGWHTDITNMTVPPSLALLYARQPLEMEGVDEDTCYSNSYRAYENLSRGLQEFLRTRRAVHKAAFFNSYNGKGQPKGATASELGIPLEQLHPCVRTHPETGKLGL